MAYEDRNSPTTELPPTPGAQEKEAVSNESVGLVHSLDSDHDIFKPFPLLEGVPLEENPLTVRAVVIGIVLGSLVNASNVYLGM